MENINHLPLNFSTVPGGFYFEPFTTNLSEIKLDDFLNKVWSFSKETARRENIPELSDIWEEALGLFGVQLVVNGPPYFVENEQDVAVEVEAHYFNGLVRMPVFSLTGKVKAVREMMENWIIYGKVSVGIVKSVNLATDTRPIYDIVEIPYKDTANEKGICFTRTLNTGLNIIAYYGIASNTVFDLKCGKHGRMMFKSSSDIWETISNRQEVVEVCRLLFSVLEFKLTKQHLKECFERPAYADWFVYTEACITSEVMPTHIYLKDTNVIQSEEVACSLVEVTKTTNVTSDHLTGLLKKSQVIPVSEHVDIWLRNPTVNIQEPVFGIFTKDLPSWMEDSPQKLIESGKLACKQVVGHPQYTGTFIPIVGGYILYAGDHYKVSYGPNNSYQTLKTLPFSHCSGTSNFDYTAIVSEFAKEVVEDINVGNSGNIIDKTSYKEIESSIVKQFEKGLGEGTFDFVLLMPNTQRPEIGLVVFIDVTKFVDENKINSWVHWELLYEQETRQKLDYWSGLTVFMCPQAQTRYNYVSPASVQEVLAEEIEKIDLPAIN